MQCAMGRWWTCNINQKEEKEWAKKRGVEGRNGGVRVEEGKVKRKKRI